MSKQMINKAERIAEELKEKAKRYQYLSDLLNTAQDVEMGWGEITSEFEDKHGWVSEKLSEMVEEIESEMAEIEGVLE
tara:strand:- start:246 stop:479 length:234 start_codon:yes stop_codon:yes gene_type:complete